MLAAALRRSVRIVTVPRLNPTEEETLVRRRSLGWTLILPALVLGACGISVTPPGQTGTATLRLAAGKYVVTEVPGPGSGPPAATHLQVTVGTPRSLPSTPTTVTAATAGKDRYRWQIAGSLKPGVNNL